MKTITSHETVVKYLQKGCHLWRPTNCGLPYMEMYIMDNQKIIGIAEFQAYQRLLTIPEYRNISSKINGNKEVKLSLEDCGRLVRKIKEKEERQKNKDLKKEAYEAIEYFKGWQEGDTITITADFMKNVEAIAEYLESLKK